MLLKTQTLRPTPRVSDSDVLGWDQGIDISNKFPGRAGAASVITILRTFALWEYRPIQQWI